MSMELIGILAGLAAVGLCGIVGLLDMGLGIAGAAGAFNPNEPDNRNLGGEYQNTLDAQLKMVPQLLAAQQKYGPQFTASNINSLQQALMGGGGTTGMMDLLRQGALAAQGIDTTTRQANLTSAAGMSPQVRGAVDAYNPGAAGLVGSLVNRAQAGMNAGSQLTPQEAMQLQRQVTNAWGQRGLGLSPSSAIQQAAAQFAGGQALQQQRQANAQSAVGTSQGFYGDLLSRVYGQLPGSGITGASGLSGAAASVTGVPLVNPESAYAADAYNTNLNKQSTFNMADAQIQQKYLGQAGSGFNSMAGAGIMGM